MRVLKLICFVMVIVAYTGCRKDDNDPLKAVPAWELFRPPNSSPDGLIMNTIATDDSFIWVGSDSGLWRFDMSAWTNFNSSNSILMDKFISCLKVDKLNRLWIGTYNAGLYIVDGNNWQAYGPSDGLPGEHVSSFEEDPAGHMWVTTFHGGLSRYDGSSWMHYDSSNSGFKSILITDVDFDRSGNMWVGTSGMGLYSYKDNIWTQYAPTNGKLPEKLVFEIFIDSRDSIWLSVIDHYVGVFNGTFYNEYNYQNSGIEDPYIRSIVEDANGNIIIGDNSWIDKFDGEKWIKSEPVYSYLFNNVNEISIDKNNRIWVATELGLARLNHW